MEVKTDSKYLEIMLKIIMEKLAQDTYLIQNFRLHRKKEESTAMLTIWMKYHQLPKVRRMHVHCMAHTQCVPRWFRTEDLNGKQEQTIWYPGLVSVG